MKLIIKKVVPEFALVGKRYILNCYYLMSCYFYDMVRYVKHSGTSRQNTQRKLLGKIIAHYHVIEKGISFDNMRAGFGQPVISNLILLLNQYIQCDYDTSERQFIIACSVLIEYFEIHEVNGKDKGLRKLKENIDESIYTFSSKEQGGSRVIYKKDIDKTINIDFKSFFESRHSIREFSEKDVDSNKIIEALNIAKKYPSVCNRQAVRVYLVTERDKVREHLSYQNGNRGFREKINKLLIITVDLSVFEGANERNQPFIDGGIYLMGVLLALHSTGLGSVALNWSMDKKDDMKYRRFYDMKDSESIIAFVGIGHLNEKMRIPKSGRNQIDDILTVIK